MLIPPGVGPGELSVEGAGLKEVMAAKASSSSSRSDLTCKYEQQMERITRMWCQHREYLEALITFKKVGTGAATMHNCV